MTEQTRYSAKTAQQDGRLRQAQLKMLAMLDVIDGICTRHDLDYWLDGGTLLGAIRHQGFIPWDDDLDIAMPRASFEKFLNIAPLEIPPHMYLQTFKTDEGFFNLAVPLKIRDRNSRLIEVHERGDEPYLQGIFVDVFVYDVMPENALQRQLYKWTAKKILRLLRPKYCSLRMGHGSSIYQVLGQMLPKSLLENTLQSIIRKANDGDHKYLGCGYDSVNSNLVAYDNIYPLKRARFETGDFKIVNNPDFFLEQQYGDYWTLPPESQRLIKHCKELIPNI